MTLGTQGFMLFFVYLSSALRVWMSPGTQSVFIESSYCVCVTVDMPALMRVECGPVVCLCHTEHISVGSIVGHGHCLHVIDNMCWQELVTQMERS